MFPQDLVELDTPSFVANVKVNGSNYDCTGFNLYFVFRGPSASAAKDRACTWLAQTTGRFQLKFADSDLDEAGDWVGEFKLSSTSDTLHSKRRYTFRVRARL